ncbi:CHAP domain-containing protein [Nonomuraea sp. NPDC048881]|uniref:CHAP domain-containing protein n=1 Tax=Nonomuraea sp. NPDC048881 TaxID=3155030 RepID=UPI0034017C86
MTTRSKFLATGKRFVGTKGRPNLFTRWYAKLSGSAYLSAAWCAMFVSYIASTVGLKSVGRFAYCPSWVNYFKREKRWGHTPKPGAIVFFDWNRDDQADHVGIVEYVKGPYVYTIEGNKGDAVRRVARSPRDILGYGYPVFDEESRTYTVKAGDSLSKVAVRFYADASKWKDIYQANRGLIGDDPALIKAGQKLKLP